MLLFLVKMDFLPDVTIHPPDMENRLWIINGAFIALSDCFTIHHVFVYSALFDLGYFAPSFASTPCVISIMFSFIGMLAQDSAKAVVECQFLFLCHDT